MPGISEFNAETFDVPWSECKKAMEAGYALILKTKTGLAKDEPRLIVCKMSAQGSSKALENPKVERFWYFDDQIQDTLVFALADAAAHVSMSQINRWLDKFGISQAAVDRIVLAALNEFPNKFKITYLQEGFSVTYKDYLDREMEATGPALEILADIRLDMIQRYKFEEAEFEDILDLNEALPNTTFTNTSPFNEDNTELAIFLRGMVG